MPQSPLLAHLARIGPPVAKAAAKPAFAARGTLPGGVLGVEVAGLGLLGAPLSPPQAQALSAISAPARFGRREQTLLDTTVRHTGEVSADAVSLQWAGDAFAALEREVAAALGLERVQASLHKLLVYGPGQFFKPHQDTEKQPGMVATLVVVWPSAHIGGALCVRHAGQEQSFASQQVGATDTLRWFAFYADCRHEVLPVEDGWRVALTFDLVLPKAAHPPAAPADPELVRLLAAEFGTEAAPRTTPWVLLLDHEYSEHGLRWAQLKGADRARALALRSAGQALGLQVDLALAELHETWTAEVAYEGRRRGRGEPAPGELIEEQLTLGWWVDAQDGPRRRHTLRIDSADTFSLRDTGPEDLVDEEYEGYMGNYGETLDYWYRRAAVVLQSPQGAWRSRVRGEFDAALAELRKLARRAGTRAGEAGPAPLDARVAAVVDLLEAGTVHLALPAERLPAYAEVAAALGDDALALRLMRGFRQHGLQAPHAGALAALQAVRGTPWLRTLVRAWLDDGAARRAFALDPPGPATQPASRTQAQALAHEWLRAGIDAQALEEVLAAFVAQVEHAAAERGAGTPAALQAGLPGLLEASCDLARALVAAPGHGPLLEALLAAVSRHGAAYPLRRLAPLVDAIGREAAATLPAAAALARGVAAALDDFLARPPRPPADFSLRGVAWRCTCADCAAVRRWAEAPGAQPLVMPMAEQRRLHVQDQLAKVAAPVTTHTLRQGSPYKLQLTKQPDLHAREQAEREAAAAARRSLDG